MSWEAPSRWLINPHLEVDSSVMVVVLFGDAKRWELKRSRWFWRCASSRKLIWPGQLCYNGFASSHKFSGDDEEGKIFAVFLTEKSFVVETLKGNT